MSITAPGPKLKNIERLVVYVTPNTTLQAINEFKNFILSQTNKEITLNNGIKINVPIVETNLPPLITEANPDSESDISALSSVSVVNDNYQIKLNDKFCYNSETKMNTTYANKEDPEFIKFFALTTENGVEVPAFLLTITILSDLSKQSEYYSLWVDSLCSNQSMKYMGGSTLLRLILAMCKKFNRTTAVYKIVNSYLEAFWEIGNTYLKQGYVDTEDFVATAHRADAFKREISPQSTESDQESPVSVEKSNSSSNFVNIDINNLEQENKLIEDLESGQITWAIDKI